MALSLAGSALAFNGAIRAPAMPRVASPMMYDRDKGSMYDTPYAPAGMGQEMIDKPRKPLSEYVGASKELAPYLEKPEPWDPLSFSLLHKVSANNPDVAWLREAELKHCRVSMLAFAGILITSGGVHFPGEIFADASAAGWPKALSSIASTTNGQLVIVQALTVIGLIEGQTLAAAPGKPSRMDLWFGEREGLDLTAGDYGFDPLGLLSPDPVAADAMRQKELTNGRLAMISVFILFQQYEYAGIDPLSL